MQSSLHSNTVPLRTLTRQLYIGNICTLPCRAPGTAFLLPLLPWRCSPGDGELALQLYVPDPRDHEERRVARLEELEDGPPFCSVASPPSSRKTMNMEWCPEGKGSSATAGDNSPAYARST